MGKKSEQGNVIELVIIGVLVLAVVGLLVWRFVGLSTNSVSDTTVTQSSSATNDNTTVTTDVSYRGQIVTSKKGAFSITIPNGWNVVNCLDNDLIVSKNPNGENIRYDISKSPEITEANDGGGWGGYTQHFYVTVSSSPSTVSGTPKNITLNDGTVAKKYYEVIAKGTTSMDSAPLDDNYNNYTYVINKGSVTVEAQFGIFDKTGYDLSLMDEIVKSIKIN